MPCRLHAHVSGSQYTRQSHPHCSREILISRHSSFSPASIRRIPGHKQTTINSASHKIIFYSTKHQCSSGKIKWNYRSLRFDFRAKYFHGPNGGTSIYMMTMFSCSYHSAWEEVFVVWWERVVRNNNHPRSGHHLNLMRNLNSVTGCRHVTENNY